MCLKLLFLVFLIALSVHGQDMDDAGLEKSEGRKSRIFPFLAVVSFPNTKCSTGTVDGLCYTASQCAQNGGTASTTKCAQGYGICCLFTQSCGSTSTITVTNNLTKLVGTGGNKLQTQPCQIKIPKKAGVCQLRLDFKQFEVGTAVGDGSCPLTDMVTFTSSNFRDGLVLCGVNTGQHLYLNYGQLDTILINTNLASGSNYEIDVTMIKCNSLERAPDGCTQYFTDMQGQVQSFNYPNQQLNTERYSVCVAGSAGQTITWSSTGAFSISGVFGSGPIAGDDCFTDFIVFPPGNRICGEGFPGSVQSSIMPFTMYVNFDESEFPIPNGPLDPKTGCPIGYLCVPPEGGDPLKPCVAGGVCRLNVLDFPFLADLIDVGNVGFSLSYSVT